MKNLTVDTIINRLSKSFYEIITFKQAFKQI